MLKTSGVPMVPIQTSGGMLARDVQIEIPSRSINICMVINATYRLVHHLQQKGIGSSSLSKTYPQANTEACPSHLTRNGSQYYHKHEWRGKCKRFQEAFIHSPKLQKCCFQNIVAPSQDHLYQFCAQEVNEPHEC